MKLRVEVPDIIILYNDYSVNFRYYSGTKRQVVPHFSICAAEDGVYSLEDWQSLISGGREGSCTWVPCELKAGGWDLIVTSHFG